MSALDLPTAVQDFLTYLRLNRDASPHTLRAYAGDLEQLVGHLGRAEGIPVAELRPSHVTPEALRGFLGALHGEGLSRASAGRKLAAIRTFLKYLRRMRVVDDDAAGIVGAPKREQKVPAHLSIEEMRVLLEMPDASTRLGRRDRAMLELFYASGLRLSELVGLNVDDVNLSSRMVRVLGKGRKERLVPFNQAAAEALRAYYPDRHALVAGRRAPAGAALAPRSRSVADPVFVNARGGRLSTRSVDRLVRKYVAMCST
ncbi:MAG: tyrosine-type recombinase/integrase, partial [Vicinamibacterales bacterium]